MKRWLLGVTGGIAAYKTPALVRLMKQQGLEVRVVLSQGAEHFVAPLSLQAVSGEPVHRHTFDPDAESAGMGHIDLARWADGVIIAPLSANRLAALALGMADDLLTTICLATRAPIFVAPAMNKQMWEHPATKQHIATLTARDIQVIGPASGEQACGEIGLGRMSEPEEILSVLMAQSQTAQPLQGKTVLITAGPTQEYFDPVRYISNRSSGKMGFALAKAAQQMGAKVMLVAGPVQLSTPVGVNRLDVISATEMQHCVFENVQKADIFISAAAVCDFRPQTVLPQKIKKQFATRQYEFAANPDILASVAQSDERPFCVGFAAETDKHEQHAREKLKQKNLDMIALNDVSRKDIGFDVDENALTVISKTQTLTIPKGSKEQIALHLLNTISEAYHATHQTENTGS